MTPDAERRVAWIPWAGLALGLVGILYGMIGFWARGYDNYDRAAIFIATALRLQFLRPQLLKVPDTPKPLLGILLTALGAFAFLPPWYVYTQIGPRPIILWWEAIALAIATIGVILIRSGPNLLREARFLLIFPLFALPLPGRIASPLHEVMQMIAAELGANFLPLLGVVIVDRDGNRILLRNGGIHIAEVCSGLYMIRTTLSVSAFIAHWKKIPLARSLVLMSLSIPIITLVNAFRVTAFGVLQDNDLRDWVLPGWKHDVVGYIAYIPGLWLVVKAAGWLTPKTVDAVKPTGVPPTPKSLPTLVASAILVAAAAGGFAILSAPSPGQSNIPAPEFERFPLQLGPWKSPGELPEDEEVKNTLTYNRALHRFYVSAGNEAPEVWIIYWKSAMTVKDYHHPDTCFVYKGFQPRSSREETLTTPAKRTIPLSYREFEGKQGKIDVVYWTQEGRRLWTAEDEARAASFWFPFYWLSDRYHGRRSRDQADDRLVVLIGIPQQGVSRHSLNAIAGRIADELYTFCPWADPAVK